MITTEIVKYTQSDYKKLCDEMRAVLSLEKEIAERKKELRDLIIDQAGGNRLEFGIKVSVIDVKGRVNYSRLITDLEIDEATLEDYREPTAERWDVRSY